MLSTVLFLMGTGVFAAAESVDDEDGPAVTVPKAPAVPPLKKLAAQEISRSTIALVIEKQDTSADFTVMNSQSLDVIKFILTVMSPEHRGSLLKILLKDDHTAEENWLFLQAYFELFADDFKQSVRKTPLSSLSSTEALFEITALNDSRIMVNHRTLGTQQIDFTEFFKSGLWTRILEECFIFGVEVIPSNLENEWMLNVLRSSKVTHLRLTLSYDTLNLKTFFQETWHDALHTLDLSDNNLGNTGAKALAKSPPLVGLRNLNLSYNNISVKAVAAFTESRFLAGLKTLNLQSNHLGDAGVVALAANKHLETLETLNLYKNDINAAGAEAIAASPHLAGLRILNFASNNIRLKGVIALAMSSYLTNLQTLKLACNKICVAGAKALAKSPHLSGLRILNLSFNKIYDEGERALEASPFLQDCELIL